MSLKLICYDLNHEPMGWEQVVKADVDVALLMNAVRPPAYLEPYIAYCRTDLIKGHKKWGGGLPAVVCMREYWSCMYFRPDLALIGPDDVGSLKLFYVHDGRSPQILSVLASDFNLSLIVCSSVPLPEELGCELVVPELYSLQEPPPLRLYTKGCGLASREVIDRTTGVQSDPQMVVTTNLSYGSGGITYKSVKETDQQFKEWLKSGEQVYVRSLNAWSGLVKCTDIRPGAIPTYMDIPITHWCKFIGGCPKCGEQVALITDGERVPLCFNCDLEIRSTHY